MFDDRAGRPPRRSTSARTSRARCAAPTRCSTRCRAAAGDDRRFNVRALRVPRRLRHRADGVGRRRATSARSTRPRLPRRSSTTCSAGRAGRCPAKQLARPQGRPTAGEDAGPTPERDLLFEDIDEPGPEHARRLRAPRRLRGAAQGARRWSRDEVLDELDGLRRARPRRRRLRDGQEGVASCPRATMDKYLVCNADESEPGTFKDRELMQKNPHLLIEGIIIAAYATGANRSFIFIRGEYALRRPTSSTRAVAEAREAGYLGERHPRLRPHARPRRAPRRRRLHLRRGDRAARLARGQARQPAPEAAVPGQPGPLPGPDADQQRRDAVERAAHHRGWAATSTPRSAYRELDGHEGRLGLRQRAAARQLRDRARHPARARSSTTSPAARRRAARSSSGSRAARRSPVLPAATDLDLPYDFDSMAKAGSMLGSGAIIVVDDSTPIARRRAEGSRSSTATSPAASARRAARARTGP